MSDAESLMPDAERLELPEVPIDYGVEHQWGNLYISEAASVAYGLQPLAANIIRDMPVVPRRSLNPFVIPHSPQIDVMIVAPDESPSASVAAITPEVPTLAADINAWYDKFGVQALVRMGGDRSQIVDQLVAAEAARYRQALENPDIGEEQITIGPDDMPLRDVVEHNYASRYIAYSLAHVTEQGVTHSSTSWHRQLGNQAMVRKATGTGSLALAGIVSAGVAGVSEAQHFPDTRLNALVGGGYAFLVASGAILGIRRQLKKYSHKADIREARTYQVAAETANTVAKDIYDLYSPDELEISFGETPPGL